MLDTEKTENAKKNVKASGRPTQNARKSRLHAI